MSTKISEINWDYLINDAVSQKQQAIDENDTETLEFFKEIEEELEQIIELGERLIRKNNQLKKGE